MTHMLSTKLAQVGDGAGGTGISFYCPGCKEIHVVWVGEGQGPRWGYNGNAERPTLTPSILIHSGHYASHWKEGDGCWCTYEADRQAGDEGYRCGICHSFVTNGQILFLQDCTHALAGQTVEIPDYPYKEQHT